MLRRHHHRHHPLRPILLGIAMAALPLSLLIILLSLSNPLSSSAATPRRPRHRLVQPPAFHRDNSSPLIQQACKATRFPDACQSTLSSASLPPNPSPSDLVLAALYASSANLKTAQSNAQAILDASAGNPNRTNAARNCIEGLGYSAHRLDRASRAVPAHALDDARAWASAALLNQYDCFSALKYVNGTQQVDDAMWFLISLSTLTSNALSMLFSYRRYGANTSLWSPPQTERDGYWGDQASPLVGGGNVGGLVRPAFPADLTPNAVVCQDAASKCYRKVQDAVDAAPDFGPGRFVIYIRAGVYDEIVRVPFEKTNVVFLGDGMGKTVITGNLNAGMVGVSTYNTATVGVAGDGFMAKGMTFQNTAGPDAHQAVAFRSGSDLSVLQEVEFLGHQDTLYAQSLRQFYNSCRIVGTVDFIFGNSASVFEGCQLLVQPRDVKPEKGETNAVTAQGRTDPAQATGFVFRDCVVNGTEEYVALYRQKPAVHKNYLGRPWKEYSRTVFVDCTMAEVVRPEGWLPWSGDFALATLFYGEYQSSGPGANPAGRVSWSSQIPAEHVGAYSVQNFIQGDGWIPAARGL